MKKVFRLFSSAALLAMLMAAAATTGFAQNPCEDFDGINELDTKIRTNYQKNETVKIAAEAGKQYLEKYGSCEVVKEFADWVKAQMPDMEKRAREYDEYIYLKARFDRFDASIKSQKYDDAYAAGGEILAKQPDNLNVMVPLGVIGLWESYKNNYKFNDETIKYAKEAMAKLKAGAKATKTDKNGNGVYGVFQFEMTKEDTISEMTFALGYINYWVKKDKKTGLPFYYEVSQLPGRYKNDPRVYQTIASFYIDEGSRLGTEIGELIAAQEKTNDTDPEEVRIKKETEIKARIALFNGYAERALDALGRAHKVAPSSTAAEKTYKEDIYKLMQDWYKRRFEKTDGLDAWVSTTLAKPMPNPASEVTPVTDPEVNTTDTTTTTTTTGNPATGVGSNTKPVSTVEKPEQSIALPENNAVKTSASPSPAKARTVAKRTTTRKRGTR